MATERIEVKPGLYELYKVVSTALSYSLVGKKDLGTFYAATDGFAFYSREDAEKRIVELQSNWEDASAGLLKAFGGTPDSLTVLKFYDGPANAGF